jgi:sigma-54 specific flagellar transcriptional regulator A
LTNDADNESKLLCRGLVGESAAIRVLRELIHIRVLRELIHKIAPSKCNVLITGETGSGKEIVARNIHYHSTHSGGRFVPINCSAIPPELLESELFGHKKGAFTGATADRDGRFMYAANGTLFLDEIGDMSPALQVKMLRVLEERVIYRVGCNKPTPMTARLVAATHRNLEQSVADGSFREDLYYRLNVIPLTVPALRERKDDLSLLVVDLSHRLKREHGLTLNLTPAAVDRLRAHDWPGNVRELANLIERLAVIHPNGTADVEDLPDKFSNVAGYGGIGISVNESVRHQHDAPPLIPEGGINLKDYLQTTEAALIREALTNCNGTITEAASLLQIGRTTLSEKVKRLGLTDCLSVAS